MEEKKQNQEQEMSQKYQLIANGVIKVIYGNMINLVNLLISRIVLPEILILIISTIISAYGFTQIIVGLFLILMQFSKAEKQKEKLKDINYLKNIELIIQDIIFSIVSIYLMFASNSYALFIGCIEFLILLNVITIVKVKKSKKQENKEDRQKNKEE